MSRVTEYKYLKSDIEGFSQFAKRRIRFLEKDLSYIKPEKILELGCGDGSLSLLLKKLTNAKVYGVDYSRSGVKLAEEKGIIVKRVDLNKGIPFDNNSFDLLI